MDFGKVEIGGQKLGKAKKKRKVVHQARCEVLEIFFLVSGFNFTWHSWITGK